MANIQIYMCGLCNTLFKQKMPCRLSISKGKGSEKDSRKADVCSDCFDGLATKIDYEFDINVIFQKPTAKEAIVPSRADNVNAPPVINKCQHDNTSYDPPLIKCKDCEEEWPA